MTIKTLRAVLRSLGALIEGESDDIDVLADGRTVTGFRVEGYLPDDVVNLELLTDRDDQTESQETFDKVENVEDRGPFADTQGRIVVHLDIGEIAALVAHFEGRIITADPLGDAVRHLRRVHDSWQS